MADEDEPSPEEQMGAAMMAVDMSVIYEYCEGQKATMITRGWSEAVADSAAGEMMTGLIRVCFK